MITSESALDNLLSLIVNTPLDTVSFSVKSVSLFEPTFLFHVNVRLGEVSGKEVLFI